MGPTLNATIPLCNIDLMRRMQKYVAAVETLARTAPTSRVEGGKGRTIPTEFSRLRHVVTEMEDCARDSQYFGPTAGTESGTPIMREELVELLTHFLTTLLSESFQAHQIAVLYSVFALGALVDLTLLPYNVESEYYFDLGRAPLSLHSVFDRPSVPTVQALVLLFVYYSHGGPHFSMEGAWSIISLVSNICQNSHLNSNDIERRRRLFWETYSMETLQGLAVGHPTSTFLANVSCPLPNDNNQKIDANEHSMTTDYHRRWQFTKQVAGPVMEVYLTAQTPNYGVIIELDHKIQQFMHSSMLLLYIHNKSFVQAMRENPQDLYYTSQATSFLSAYRSASEIIKADMENFTCHPELFSRWWPIWKSLLGLQCCCQLITASSESHPDLVSMQMIVRGIAAKCPRNKFAPQRIGNSNSMLAAILRDKAISAYSKSSGHDLSDDESDETLDIFVGNTRVITQTIIVRDPPLADVSVHNSTSIGPNTSHTQWTANGSNTIDESLILYFSLSGEVQSENQMNWADITTNRGYSPDEQTNTAPDSVSSLDSVAYDPSFFSEQDSQWTQFLQSL
ncbi:hypothetical protein B0H10DRAFT_1955680 [Mycena sp. CBHHK59/15]|nr:hypothetical protein B0H10DRAFT_1955680 [Mycena sp. CBHHK59/15]